MAVRPRVRAGAEFAVGGASVEARAGRAAQAARAPLAARAVRAPLAARAVRAPLPDRSTRAPAGGRAYPEAPPSVWSVLLALLTLLAAGAATTMIGCGTPPVEAPPTPPVAAGPPQYRVNLDLGRQRDGLREDIAFLERQIAVTEEEVIWLERELDRHYPNGVRPVLSANEEPSLPELEPMTPVKPSDAKPSDAKPSETTPREEPADPVERRLRRETAELTAARARHFRDWSSLLARQRTFQRELTRLSKPPPVLERGTSDRSDGRGS